MMQLTQTQGVLAFIGIMLVFIVLIYVIDTLFPHEPHDKE